MYKKINTNETKLKSFFHLVKMHYSSQNSLGEALTVDGVKQAILELNTSKARGPDGLPSLFYQICIDDISD